MKKSKKYSAIIADDEKNLCVHLHSLLNKLWPELDIIGTAYNGSEALTLIKQEEPDIAFLDIKMPVMSGIDVARHIAVHLPNQCNVVFVTAYDEFAVQAFEQNAVDYLLKPVSEERLLKTINRLKDDTLSNKTNLSDLEKLFEKLSSGNNKINEPEYLQWIQAGKSDKTILIPVTDVCYFKASDKYTSVITHDGEYLIRKPIKELVTKLDNNKFWQINRGIIVNVDCISSTHREINGRCKVYLKNSDEVLVASRKYSHLFKQM